MPIRDFAMASELHAVSDLNFGPFQSEHRNGAPQTRRMAQIGVGANTLTLKILLAPDVPEPHPAHI